MADDRGNNKVNIDYRYSPTILGKIALSIALPAAVIGMIAVIAAFWVAEAFWVCLIGEAIALVGGVFIVGDIVVFNIRQRNGKSKQNKPKEMDIMRAVHMVIGIIVGIIIGYLIWH